MAWIATKVFPNKSTVEWKTTMVARDEGMEIMDILFEVLGARARARIL